MGRPGWYLDLYTPRPTCVIIAASRRALAWAPPLLPMEPAPVCSPCAPAALGTERAAGSVKLVKVGGGLAAPSEEGALLVSAGVEALRQL